MLNRLRAVFRSFQHHDVKYVVIGGIASVLHGVPRATFDLDILIEATPDNARRLLEALLEAGLGTASLTTAEAVLANEITIFRDRLRIRCADVHARSGVRGRLAEPPDCRVSGPGLLHWGHGTSLGAMRAAALLSCGILSSGPRAQAQIAPDILWQEDAAYGYTSTSVAVSPDGLWAATPGGDGVQIWRISDGARMASLPHGSYVASLAFSADGALLAVGGGSPPVSVWHIGDWSLAYALTQDVSPGPVAFSPDSSLLAVASGYFIQLRSAADGALLHSWKSLFGADYLAGVVTLAFSPDGTRLASGGGYRGEDISFIMWSVPSGEMLLRVPTAQTYNVGFVGFSPDGQLLVTGGGSGPMQLWQVADGAPVRTFPERAFSAAFSPDGAQLAVVERDIAFYGVASGNLNIRYSDAANGSRYQKAVGITPDGSAFIRVCFPGNVLAARVPLWIHSVVPEGDRWLLSWSGGGQRCRVQRRASLFDGDWENVGDVVANGTAEISADWPAAFFRVIALAE